MRNKQKNSGYMMAGVGFVMLLANAFSYIFNWNIKSPAPWEWNKSILSKLDGKPKK